MKKAISFFAGAGGLDIGMHKAGFDIKASFELEPIYCKTLQDNNPSFNVVQSDIMQLNKELIYRKADLCIDEEIDLIFGGSPCQSFSTAGKRQGFNDKKGQAMLKFIDLINEIKPKIFLLENVKGLLSASLKHRPMKERTIEHPPLTQEEKKGSALKYLFSYLSDYKVCEPKILNSADYGVPQKRERVFIVGIRKDIKAEFLYPEVLYNESGSDGKKKYVTFLDVMKQLEGIEHEYVNYSKERLKYMKMIPKGGGNWRNLSEAISKEAMGGAFHSGGGKTGYFRRIKADEPAPTLLTSPIQKSTNIGHPYEDRPLSLQEYLVIQGFGRDYKVSGTLQQKYTQIGNAVPVKIAEIIGKQLIQILG